MIFNDNFYIFNSRVATHVLFWIFYFIFFGLLWAGEDGYLASFYLEFILLPIRIMAVYVAIYYLLPKFLLKRKFSLFFLGYCLTLLLGGVLQRIFIHLFYEELLLNDISSGLFSLRMLIRAIVLINTTVLLVLGMKLFQLWSLEHQKNAQQVKSILEIKANRRIHRVAIEQVLFIEGLGNYVIYNLSDDSKLTVYGTIKETLSTLPDTFVRVHKSYIINKKHIKSYDTSSIDVHNHMVPRGKSVTDQLLLN